MEPRCPLQQGVLSLRCKPVPGAVDHTDSGVLGQALAMAVVKFPIQRIERTAVGAILVLNRVGAPTAMVGHLVDVCPTGDIGFTAQYASIGKLAHAPGIGHFDPFNRVLYALCAYFAWHQHARLASLCLLADVLVAVVVYKSKTKLGGAF